MSPMGTWALAELRDTHAENDEALSAAFESCANTGAQRRVLLSGGFRGGFPGHGPQELGSRALGSLL